MMKVRNYSGQRIGHLVLTDVAHTDKWGSIKWNAICDCGGMAVPSVGVLANSFRSVPANCGCIKKRKHKHKDITGRVRGDRTAISFAGYDKKREALWVVRCKCGSENTVAIRAFAHGGTCGCAYHGEGRRVGNTRWNPGDRTGQLTLVRRLRYKERTHPLKSWWVRCDCGNERDVFVEVLGRKNKHGLPPNCGCLLKEWQRTHSYADGVLKTSLSSQIRDAGGTHSPRWARKLVANGVSVSEVAKLTAVRYEHTRINRYLKILGT